MPPSFLFCAGAVHPRRPAASPASSSHASLPNPRHPSARGEELLKHLRPQASSSTPSRSPASLASHRRPARPRISGLVPDPSCRIRPDRAGPRPPPPPPCSVILHPLRHRVVPLPKPSSPANSEALAWRPRQDAVRSRVTVQDPAASRVSSSAPRPWRACYCSPARTATACFACQAAPASSRRPGLLCS